MSKRWNLGRLVAAWVVAVAAGCGGGSDSSSTGAGDAGSAFGLDQRTDVAGLNISSSAASAWRATEAFANLASIDSPTFMVHAGDGTNRLFVGQKNGVVRVFANRADVASWTTYLDLRASVDASTDDSGLLGMAFDPDYRSNGYVYVSYVTLAPRRVRLSRFQVSGDANVANPASERVVYEYAHERDWHYGGWLGFGPDRMLYLSTGDNIFDPALQDPASPYGKLLRMRVNADGSASVPADNPFGNFTWAMGFRNPWRCSFDRANGDLWCGDVGEDRLEEINRVQRGRHYGWDTYEGNLPMRNPANLPYADFEPPVHMYDRSLGFAVIGGFVYRGSAHPSLVGRYLYADFASSNLSALVPGGGGVTLVADNLSQPTSLGEDEAGEVYVVSNAGRVLRLEATAASGTGMNLPATLSATGIFADTAGLVPKDGMIDYEVNAPFWSDGATKQRWFTLPSTAKVGFDASQAWTFPVGTVTVKHLELPQPGGGSRRVETRVMVLGSEGWRGAAYRWRDDGSDADLVTTAQTASVTTIDPVTQSPSTLQWQFPSPQQCLICHSAAAGRVLGLSTAQMNRDHRYAATGITDNQLRTFAHMGLFDRDIGAPSSYAPLPDPFGAADTASRARAYLDVNCSLCHRPSGPTPVSMDLRYTTALEAMNVVGQPASSPTTPGALRVVPGQHDASDLWRRIVSTSSVHMPPIGSVRVDQAGADLVSAWIDGLR